MGRGGKDWADLPERVARLLQGMLADFHQVGAHVFKKSFQQRL
jgi:hypothetical protein